MVISVTSWRRGGWLRDLLLLGFWGLSVVCVWAASLPKMELVYGIPPLVLIVLLFAHFRLTFNRRAARELNDVPPGALKAALTRIVRDATKRPFVEWRDLAARLSAKARGATILVHQADGTPIAEIAPIPHLFEPVLLRDADRLEADFKILSSSGRHLAPRFWTIVVILFALLIAMMAVIGTIKPWIPNNWHEFISNWILMAFAYGIAMVLFAGASHLIFAAVEWVFRKTRDYGLWLIAPSALLRSRLFAGERRVLRRSECLLLAVQRDNRWSITVASEGKTTSLSVNHRQLEILLSAWLSPIEAPPLEHDEEFIRESTPS